jgi:mannose-6-phosphate isomerase-like protein (cupin superfamily)
MPSNAHRFKYEKPEFPEGKTMSIVNMARTDHMLARVQVHKRGGEIQLHAHRHVDGFWMVLKGRCKFYTEGDVLIADAGPGEGVLLPRGYQYWFEKEGDEDLEILQVEAFDVAIPGEDTPKDLVDNNYASTPKPIARMDGRLPLLSQA